MCIRDSVQPGQRRTQLVRHVRGEALLAQQLALQTRRHGVQGRRHRGHLVLRTGRVLRAGVADARVEVARADPPGHPGGGVQPPGHPGHREHADQDRRPDREPRRPHDRVVEAGDGAGLLRVVDRHGECPVPGHRARRPHGRPPVVRGDHRAPPPGHRQLPQRRRQSRGVDPGVRQQRVPGLVRLGGVRELGQGQAAGLADGLVRHRDVHQHAEQRGQRTAHHRDERGRLHGERPGPLGQREPHRGLAEGEADGEGEGFLACRPSPVCRYSSRENAIARCPGSHTQVVRYS